MAQRLVRIKRVYDKPERTDGTRILVDRLWPRGLTKQKAKVDEWLKEMGPSTELRKWFGHDPKRWVEFAKKYRAELRSKKDLLNYIKAATRKGVVTLVYGAKDTDHNEAVILQQQLNKSSFL